MTLQQSQIEVKMTEEAKYNLPPANLCVNYLGLSMCKITHLSILYNARNHHKYNSTINVTIFLIRKLPNIKSFLLQYTGRLTLVFSYDFI